MDEDDKLTLDYYLSIPLNPFREDNSTTQEDVIDNANLQFKMDCITKTIGTPECKYNISEFWFDIFEEVYTEDMAKNFLLEIWNKLIYAYDLEILKDRSNIQTMPLLMRREIYEMLEFFEQGTCTKIIARFLEPDNINVLKSDQQSLLQYLLLRYNIAIKEINNVQNHMPESVFYALTMMAKRDFVKLIFKLINANLNAVISDVISLTRGS